MKAKFQPGVLSGICTVFLACLTFGCAQEKDFYEPDNNPLPNENEYFGFETRKDLNLNVNYDTPVQALLEVYAEDPMEVVENTPVKKDGVEALFKIYTDANGKFNGKMDLPTSLESVYLYTSAWGLPRSVKLTVENGSVNFDMSAFGAPSTKAVTKSYDFEGKQVPYSIDANRNLYSLCQWGGYGSVTYDRWGNPLEGYIQETSQVGDESMDSFVNRMQNFLLKRNPSTDNSDLVRSSDITNITLTKEASVKVVFVNRDASYNNTFGYYYYKTGSQPDVKAIKKYIVFPNVYVASANEANWGIRVLKCGDKATLRFFGENGDKAPSEKFPAGYTIGWFIYSDGYDMSSYADRADQIKPDASLVTSNDARMQYIALDDKTTAKVIIGVEDGGNQSYCDLLFYAEVSPENAIDNTNKPSIDDPDKPNELDKPDGVETKTGTLAFEDIWPTGGDYDMNDFIVEYRHEVTFNKDNRIKKIVHQFTPVYKNAGLVNTFAFQIDSSEPLGWVGDLSDGITVEKETNSFLVCQGLDANIGKTFTITRDFMQGDIPPIRKDEMKKYNPYLISGYKGETPRIEVHLPKHKPTDKIDAELVCTGDDAYYIDKDGFYPFAIDISIIGFSQKAEKTPIDKVYPDFAKWVGSKGEEATDWYNK